MSYPSKAGVEFDRDEFDQLLKDKGYLVCWEKASSCPNRPTGGAHVKAHDPSCTVCDGTSFVYFDEEDTEMLIQAVKLNQQFYAQGRWDIGMILVTARPDKQISYWDRITIKNGLARFTEIVRRQGDLDVLKYAATCVDYVAWMDRSEVLVKAIEDTDFVVTTEGDLSWVGTGSKPDIGTYYTIAYSYHPRYVILDLLHQHRESPVNGTRVPFPVQAVARADFLIRDEGKDEPQVRFEDPFR